jgi:hypothetical protein
MSLRTDFNTLIDFHHYPGDEQTIAASRVNMYKSANVLAIRMMAIMMI